MPLHDLPPLDETFRERARARQSQLTKPPGSLGRLEDLAVQLAAIQRSDSPQARPCSVLLFAADHPVTAQRVSPYPSAVTAAMVANFVAGGAAASVLSRHHGLPLHVENAGIFGTQIDAEFPAGDLSQEDAMPPATFEGCIDLGRRAVSTHAAENRLTIFGEMGIGNTTAAAAVCAAFLAPVRPDELVGAGTGAKGAIYENKLRAVESAVGRLASSDSPREVLRKVGGREMAALYGAMGEALRRRSAILVDGFIATAVALVVVSETPQAKDYMVFSHCSDERGHRKVLDHLGVEPLLDLEMRLGEASGALVAFALVEQACAVHNHMATFASAGVPGASE